MAQLGRVGPCRNSFELRGPMAQIAGALLQTAEWFSRFFSWAQFTTPLPSGVLVSPEQKWVAGALI